MVTRDHSEHGAHGYEGQHGAALGERNVAQGTITSISGTGFVLATGDGTALRAQRVHGFEP